MQLRRRAASLVTVVLVAALAALGAIGLVGRPAAAAPSPFGEPQPTGLTVDQRTAPADVDDLTGALLGWQVPAAQQAAYQVQVATSTSSIASGNGLTWDSGRVSSPASTNVPYAGPALQHGQSYLWRVRTWATDGTRSPWSRPARFGTSLGSTWSGSHPIWLGPSPAVDWSDYTLDATFAITAQNASIVFNAQDADNYLMWQFRGNSVNTLAPHQKVNGTFTQLASVPLPVALANGADHHVRIQVFGSTVTTWLDGTLVDTRTGVRFTSGTIGFRTGGSERSSWDDLTVTGADGSTLYRNDFEQPSADFSCGTVAGGRLVVGTGQNCVYGVHGQDWAFLRGDVTTADKEVAWATVFATGSSPEPGRQYVYKLWMNGRFVGLGPTRSIAAETRYDGYDVTDLVRRGAVNTLGALAWTTSDRKFQAQLVVGYADGSRQTFGTGDGWRSLPGDTVYPSVGSIGTSYYTAPKENLQAASYPTGFAEPGFDDRAWWPVTVKADYADLEATPTAKVTERLEQPEKVVETEPGHYFIDYGRTWLGGLSLDLAGTAGEKVTLRFGEELSGTTTVRYALRTGNSYEDVWTLGSGRQHLETWGMRVFRYAEVIGAPPGLGAADFPALAQVYPSDAEAARFASSDDALNQVWALAHHTIAATDHNLYVDSWTREREPYEADSYLQMLGNFYTQSDPTLGTYSTDFLLTRRTWPTEWPMYTILAMHDSYEQTGDVTPLQRSYDQLVAKLPTKWLDPTTGMVRKTTGSNGCSSSTDCDIVDWPTSERDGYVFTPVNTVINAIGYRSFMDMAAIATALGKDADAATYTATAERLRTAMNRYLWDDAKGAYRDGLNSDGTPIQHWAVHASVFASAFGVPDAAQSARAADYVGGQGMRCSVYCAAFVIESLYNGDRGDLALKLLTDTGIRSWMNMIADGAGATGEAWDPSLKSNMTYSHPWAASPAYNVPQGLFGIHPTTPGYATYDVRPQPGTLSWAHVTVPILKGHIGVAFHVVDGRTDLGVRVPGNTVATVSVPAEGSTADVVYVDGRPVAASRDSHGLSVRVAAGCHYVSVLGTVDGSTDDLLTPACG